MARQAQQEQQRRLDEERARTNKIEAAQRANRARGGTLLAFIDDELGSTLGGG